MGDILLPEGRTVEDLTAEAVTSAFRDSGYRVLGKGDPGFESAKPVEIDIDKFWAWFNPGFWSISLEFQASVRISGPVKALQGGQTVEGYTLVRGQAAGTKAWLKVMNLGLQNLMENLRKLL